MATKAAKVDRGIWLLGDIPQKELCFEDQFTDLHELRCQTYNEIGSSTDKKNMTVDERNLKFEDVHFEDLGEHVGSSPSCAILQGRDLAKIGEWKRPADGLTMVLLLAGTEHSALASIEGGEPVLLVIQDFPISLHCGTSLRSSVDVHLAPLDPVINRARSASGSLDDEEEYLGGGTCEFDDDHRAHAYTLYLGHWCLALWRWSIANNLSRCKIRFRITSVGEMIRYADLSGVMRLMQRVPELRDMIVDHLSLSDLQMLRSTCKDLREKLSDTVNRRLRRSIAPYFPDVATFSAALRRHHALLSGSTVLSIIRPGDWHPQDLDLVVSHRHAHGMQAFLQTQGYEEVTSALSQASLYPGIFNTGARVFYDYHCYRRGTAKVDLCVVQCRQLSPADYVMTYHSTAVMNFFDGRGVFCLFPDETFDGRFLQNSYTPSARLSEVLKKISSRGYEDTGEHIQGRYPAMPQDGGLVKASWLKGIWHMRADV